MLINGEKYACEACVRGHRVSACTHADRKLLHVNKKGRPVSQCPHCRSLRKNRSQHVKCECHDKSHAKEDCPHLKELQEASTGSASNACCCGHGARCTCSLKKEPFLESVPEDLTHILAQRKEKLQQRGPNVNQHDSKPTVFTNGHHKPVHKFNDAHNHCGAPYRIPSRSNSHHGHREIAQRSTDSLPLTARQAVHHESPLHSVMNALQPARQARSEHNSPLLAPTSNPGMAPFQVEIPPLSPNDYSYSPFKSQSPGLPSGPHLPETIPDNWFTTHEEAHNNGPPSVPELAYIDWSKYGFGGTPTTLDNNGMQPLYALDPTSGLGGNSQIPSYATSMEHLNQLNSSSGFNTSSGEISEVEDLPLNFRPSTLRTISHASNDLSSTGATDDGESHRLSTTSSYFSTPAANMLASNMEDLDIDKFINEQKQKHSLKTQAFQTQSGLTEFSPQPMPQQQQQQQQQQNILPHQQPTPPQSLHTMSTPPESIRGFSITSHPSPGDGDSDNDQQIPYSIAEAQSYAHMLGKGTHEKNKVQMMQKGVYEDPMWGGSGVDQYGNDREFSLDDEREDEDWVR